MIRQATPQDIPALLAIKQRLTFASARRGGFLLGCDEQGYQERLRAGRIWVLQKAKIEGFAITLSPPALRASPLWAASERISWAGCDPKSLDAVGYFDQLAVLPEADRRGAVALAFVALWTLLSESEHVVTTTVAAPVLNLAAVPLIERVGGTRVGQLREFYPDVGPLTSDVWLLHAEQVRRELTAAPRLGRLARRLALSVD